MIGDDMDINNPKEDKFLKVYLNKFLVNQATKDNYRLWMEEMLLKV